MVAMMMVLLGLALGSANSGDVEWIAHRGESADAPENTMAAFRLAWERKVPTIELDIHQAKDGSLIVIHDADTERVTGKKLVVKESTLEELRELDAGRWKGAEWAGEKLPVLAEVLETIPEGSRCFVEIKVGPEIVPELVKVIQESGKKPEQLAFISFNAKSLALIKEKLPEIPTYYLSSFRQDKETKVWSPTVEELIAKAKEIKADGLDLSYRGPIDREFVQKAKDAGLEFYVWTVNELDDARRFIEAGVDGITTDKGDWLRRELSKD